MSKSIIQINKIIHGVFEGQAQQVPRNIAIKEGGSGREYSYQQLLEDSELLSRYIILSQNIISSSKSEATHKGKLIGILSEKGYNQVISTLAIMKSGHSYLPLSIDWPVHRLDEVLKEGHASILLISRAQYEQEHIRNILSISYNLIVIEDVLAAIREDTRQKKVLNKISLPHITPEDIAYVIFTSGSTGKPKGVTISHRGALNTIDAVNERFNVTQEDKVLALAELSFDLSVYDIFGLLAVGGTVVFPAQDKMKDSGHWVQLYTY